MEQTLVILKPDCVQRGLCGEVITRLEKRGLKISAMKMVKLSAERLEEHYSHLKGKPFFPKLMEFMSASPVVIAIIEGNGAVEIVRKMCGATNARNADVGTIRGDLGLSTQCNIIHASDSKETAEKEIKRFFRQDEIFSYKRVLQPLTYSDDELG